MPGTSPASQARVRRLDQALDQANPDRNRNRDEAAKLLPSHGDPPRSRNVPNTNPGRVAR
jgi:hypothetical protein